MKYYKPLGCWNQDPPSFYEYHANSLNTEIISRDRRSLTKGTMMKFLVLLIKKKKAQIEFDLNKV